MNKSDWRNSSKVEYDEVVLNQLKNIEFNTNKNLIFIHLMGSHTDYKDRYPAKYNYFNGDGTNVDTYNNSILYNDYVLSQIYDISKNFPNFKGMIYLSDHGDDAYRELGHNSANFTWDMVKIPFWMILSDDFIKNRKSEYNALKSHINTPITNDLIFDTLLGIIGLKNNQFYSEGNDFSSKEYNHSFEDLKTLHGQKSLNRLPDKNNINKVKNTGSDS